MSDDGYVVKSQQRKWSEGVHELGQLEQAIGLAKRRAIETGEPHEVYELSKIGCSSIPKSDFIDFRPQAAPAN